MKKVILCICFLLSVNTIVEAQKAKKKNVVKKETSAKGTVTEKKQPNATSISRTNSDTITLSSTSANTALGSSAFRLPISDPTIKLLNANAGGANIKLNPSGLIGVPKGTYGFANGKIVLYTNGATSTGTSTGMGSVGTGTSPGNVGGLGPALGVNGKSPYAGPGPYGTRLPLKIYPVIDTTKNAGIRSQ